MGNFREHRILIRQQTEEWDTTSFYYMKIGPASLIVDSFSSIYKEGKQKGKFVDLIIV